MGMDQKIIYRSAHPVVVRLITAFLIVSLKPVGTTTPTLNLKEKRK
jgi:hypothetical protein